MPRRRTRRTRGRHGKSPFNAVSLPATLLGAAVLCYFAVQFTMDPSFGKGRRSTTARSALRPAFLQARGAKPPQSLPTRVMSAPSQRGRNDLPFPAPVAAPPVIAPPPAEAVANPAVAVAAPHTMQIPESNLSTTANPNVTIVEHAPRPTSLLGRSGTRENSVRGTTVGTGGTATNNGSLQLPLTTAPLSYGNSTSLEAAAGEEDSSAADGQGPGAANDEKRDENEAPENEGKADEPRTEDTATSNGETGINEGKTAGMDGAMTDTGTVGEESMKNNENSAPAANSEEPSKSEEGTSTNDTVSTEEGEDDSAGLSRIGRNITHESVQVRHGNQVLRIPRGSRVTGNPPEFLGVVPVRGGMVRGQNVTRVSYALFKIIQLFEFRSMIDSPCGAHVEWMSEMLHRLEFDRPMFRYMGIDTNCSVLPHARERVGEIGQEVDFRCVDVLGELPGPANVLFYWPELGGVHDPRSKGYPGHIEEVMRNAKDRNITFIVIPQWPRVKNRPIKYRYGRWVFEGEDDGYRPFLMNEQVRGVVPIVQNSDDPYIMYMTFYALPSISFYG